MSHDHPGPPQGNPYPQQPHPQQPYPQQSAYPQQQRHLAPPAHHLRDFLDGVPLAGWWQRVGAVVLDGLILMAITVPVTWPWLSGYWNEQMHAREEMMQDIENGETVSPFSTFTAGYEDLVVYTLIGLLIAVIYQAVFLRLWQATPGKRIVGIKVRSRPHDGPLSWGTIAKRITLQYFPSPLMLVPIMSILGGIYALLDGLWPLWDRHRQAIHEKWANTSVVRTR